MMTDFDIGKILAMSPVRLGVIEDLNGLNTDSKREEELQKLTSVIPYCKLLENHSKYKMYLYEATISYVFALSKRTKDLIYYMKYEKNDSLHSFIPSSFIQISVWRAKYDSDSLGLPQRFIHTFGPKLFPAIVSDDAQSDDGIRLWKDTILPSAYSDGRIYGLVDTISKKLYMPKEKETYKAFYSRVEDLAYGKTIGEMSKTRFRFFAYLTKGGQ